jgi:hypothetical protein
MIKSFRGNVKSLCPETLNQLAERWTVLINQINHHELRYYPDAFFSDVNGLIQQTERIVDPDPSSRTFFILPACWPKPAS